MVVSLYQIVAGLYLIASVAAAAGYSLSHQGLARVAVSTLVRGWGLHVLGFAALRPLAPAPPRPSWRCTPRRFPGRCSRAIREMWTLRFSLRARCARRGGWMRRSVCSPMRCGFTPERGDWSS